jgi:hypothetical protein
MVVNTEQGLVRRTVGGVENANDHEFPLRDLLHFRRYLAATGTHTNAASAGVRRVSIPNSNYKWLRAGAYSVKTITPASAAKKTTLKGITVNQKMK